MTRAAGANGPSTPSPPRQYAAAPSPLCAGGAVSGPGLAGGGELARHGAGRAAWGAAKTPHNGPPGGAQHRLVRSGRGGCPRSRSAQHRLVRAHRGPGEGPSAAPPPTPPRQRRDQRPPSSPSTPPPIVPRIVSRLVPAPPPRRPTPRRAFHLSGQDLASLATWRRPGGGGQK